MSDITERTLQIDPNDDWSYAVSSAFVQGTTHELRRRGQRVHDLSLQARMIYIYLRSYVGPNSKVPFPSVDRICGDLRINHSTLKKYRRELEAAGYLERRQRRADGVFLSNSYTLKCSPSVKFSSTVKSSTVKPSSVKAPTKSTHVLKENPIHEVENQEEGSAPDGASARPRVSPPAGVVGSPSAARSKAKLFISEWKSWYSRFYQQDQILDSNQEKKIRAFFQDNTEIMPREVIAIALNAWMQGELDTTEGQESFLCVNHSKLPGNLLNNLTALMQEIAWKRTEKRIARQYTRAEERIESANTGLDEEA